MPLRDRCLQEITYLTSSSTLNPLSATSYAAPALVRPRKILSEYPAPPSAIPLNSTAAPIINSLNPIGQAGLYSLANNSNNGYNSSTLNGARPASSEHASNYPSDPASVFVPLTRQGSLQGSRGSSIRAIELEAERPDAADREREGRESREAREGAGTTTSFMAVKPPPPSPPVTPAPPPEQSTPDVPLQLSEPPEEEEDEEEGGERTMGADDASLDVNSIDDDEPPPFLGDSGRRGSLSARGGGRGVPLDRFGSLRKSGESEQSWTAREPPSIPPSTSSVDDIDDDTPSTPFDDSDSLYSAAYSSSRMSSSFGEPNPRLQGLYDLRDFSNHPSSIEREQDALADHYSGLRHSLSEGSSASKGEKDDELDRPREEANDEGDVTERKPDEEGKSGLVWENDAGELSEHSNVETLD